MPLERERVRAHGAETRDLGDGEELGRPDAGRALAQHEQHQQRPDDAAEAHRLEARVAPDDAQLLLDERADRAGQAKARAGRAIGRGLAHVELAAIEPLRDERRDAHARRERQRHGAAEGECREALAASRVHGGARAPRERREREHVALEQRQQQPARHAAATAQHQDREQAQRHPQPDPEEDDALVQPAVPRQRVQQQAHGLADGHDQQHPEREGAEGEGKTLRPAERERQRQERRHLREHRQLEQVRDERRQHQRRERHRVGQRAA